MRRYSILKSLSDIVTFIFIFSIFNDNFLVDRFGENILKMIFLLFIIFNIRRIYRTIFNLVHIRRLTSFLVFAFLSFLVLIINPPPPVMEYLFPNFMLVISMVLIVIVFSTYDLQKSIYFIWVSLLLSSLICFFNSPISQWTFRKTGGTGDPNEFATHMISLLFVSIYLYTQNKKIYLLIISSIAFLYSVMFAASMSSFLVLGMLGLLVLIRYLSLSFTKSLIISCVSLIVFIFGFIVFQDKLINSEIINNILGRTEQTGTAYTRFNSWNAGLHMFADKPILGVGFNAYNEFSPKYSKVYLSEDSVAPHNLYLKILAESGIVVFFAFLYFLIDLLKKYFSKIISSKYFWMYMALTGDLLMGLTLGIAYNKFIWLTIAVLMNIHTVIKLERSRKEKLHTQDFSFYSPISVN